MRKFILIVSILAVLFCLCLSESKAQQKSIIVLIKTSLNGADAGFPSFINDTLPDIGEWKYKINPEIVKQFAEVSDIKINIKRNQKSHSINDTLFQINQMKIISNDIIPPPGVSRSIYLDSVVSRYNKIINFFKNELGAQFNYTDIIQQQNQPDLKSSLYYITYFYENSTTLNNNITDAREIEKHLDVVKWISVELLQNPLNKDSYCVVYRINGAESK